MSNSNHGELSQRGINLVISNLDSPSIPSEGRFGRMFPELVNKTSRLRTQDLVKIGRKGGPMDGGTKKQSTYSVPLGFIFLGQFIDHDITFDPISRLDAEQDPLAVKNFRTPALDLDNIYREGPGISNYLYNRNLSSFGKGNFNGFLVTGAEGTAFPLSNGLAADDLPRNSVGTAIIGDPRNDENRIISQLHLAFLRFHNRMMKKFNGNFEEASKTVKWCYQWIIVHEFLPYIIGEKLVYDILTTPAEYRFYKPKGRPFIPIEFAVAAYRFGHSMITHQVKLNDQTPLLDLFSEAVGRSASPISDKDQIVDWKHFFKIGQNNPQKASKLDAKLAATLLELPFIPPVAERSLASRNLVRGKDFKLPAGEVIAEFIKEKTNGITDYEIELTKQTVADLLKSDPETAQINILDAGIPLWLYILAEAACIGRTEANGQRSPGEGLGPVGGRIVGEVLIGLLEADITSYLYNNTKTNKPQWEPEGGDFKMADLIKESLKERGVNRGLGVREAV
ncbi:MAG: heme peroxidase family protein [Saprospiraceae bacterium]|nr:heme peroxidase family protein [Saprospiraceae bacterium]